jgi:dTDP-4-dehydrorhamnose 3,5-epimerase
MQIIPTSIPDVKIFAPKRFADARGFFSEVYNQKALTDFGCDLRFVQDNHSLSRAKGVVRGLHYQVAPAAQAKLIRVIHGAILDVAVDIRKGSPTFGKHICEVLSAENWRQALVPVGFAHGFATLEPDTEVIYKVTAPYSPKDERGIKWNDPALGIDWPVGEDSAILSDRDKLHPLFADVRDWF